METDGPGCSLYHCGANPPVSYEYAEAYRQSVIEAWKDDDKWGFASRYANLKVKPNGTVDF